MDKTGDIRHPRPTPGGPAQQPEATANTPVRGIVLAIVIIGLIMFGFVLQFATLT